MVKGSKVCFCADGGLRQGDVAEFVRMDYCMVLGDVLI